VQEHQPRRGGSLRRGGAGKGTLGAGICNAWVLPAAGLALSAWSHVSDAQLHRDWQAAFALFSCLFLLSKSVFRWRPPQTPPASSRLLLCSPPRPPTPAGPPPPCCPQAAILTGEQDEQVTDLLLLDVTPLSLGIGVGEPPGFRAAAQAGLPFPCLCGTRASAFCSASSASLARRRGRLLRLPAAVLTVHSASAAAHRVLAPRVASQLTSMPFPVQPAA
jgi:hypothetical protein